MTRQLMALMILLMGVNSLGGSFSRELEDAAVATAEVVTSLPLVNTTQAVSPSCSDPEIKNFNSEDKLHAWVPVRAANQAIVQACASRVPINTRRSVRLESRNICRRTPNWWTPNVIHGGNFHYFIARKPSGIHVQFKLRLNIPPSVERGRAHAMLENAMACIPQLRAVWRRYGIIFDLKLDSNREPDREQPQHEVRFTDSLGRSSTADFFYRGLNTPTNRRCSEGTANASCETSRQDSFCLLMLHETGHMLGFPDEYSEPDVCPDRHLPEGPDHPVSVMRSQWHGWENIEFFPRHLRALIAPLCEDVPVR